jgi:murein L,D-transpeptidase YcbB/YkuD
MTVVYKPIDGELVSAEWYAVLTKMRSEGVQFHVNEGHRTMARQAQLYALYRAGRGALAAVPSPYAPHIRTGRIDHAIDFNGAAGVIAWLHRNGGSSAYLAVPGESWHVEVSAAQLRSMAAHFDMSGNDPTLHQGQVGPSIVRLKKLLYSAGMREFSGAHSSNRYNPYFSKYTKASVRRFQIAHHLGNDGVVGPKTWAALRKAAA